MGAGGLGCPAALYLAASGFGRLTIADSDTVDLTNLQRQILYTRESVGRSKAAAAREALLGFNAQVQVSAVASRLEGEPLDALVAAADVVLDCSDNFATRHAINRACVRHARPLVAGAAIRFDGQLMVFDRRDPQAPCYACLFPESGETEELRCAVMGVFAPLTGIVGALQAMETIRLIAGVGEPAGGRLLAFDAKNGDWRAIRVKKDPDCEVCARAAQASR